MQGGIPGAANLGGCAALESIVRKQAEKGGLYAAICAAPAMALAPWGLLNGCKVFLCVFIYLHGSSSLCLILCHSFA